MQKNIFLLSATYSLFVLLFIPFVSDSKVLFSPYSVSKTLFFRGIIMLGAVLLAAFFIFAKKEEKKAFISKKLVLLRNPLCLFVLLFLISVAISTVFAKQPYRAFFGTVERGEGFVGFFFFSLLFFLSLLLFEQKEWRIFLWASAATGIVVFFQTFFQFTSAEEEIRPYATFGNPGYLAQYLLFPAFAAFFLLTSAGSDFVKKRNIAAILFLIFAIAASLGGIILSQTRAAIFGFAAGAGISLFYLALSSRRVFLRKEVFTKTKARFLVAALLVGVIFFGYFIISSYRNLSHFIFSRNAEARLIALKGSFESVSPMNEGIGIFLFGWGPDNFTVAHNKYFYPTFFKYETAWFDRAHNRFADVLVMQGLFGFVAYLAIWLSLLYAIFRLPRGDKHGGGDARVGLNRAQGTSAAVSRTMLSSDSMARGALLFFAVSYFIQSLFWFDTPAASVVFFLFLSLAASRQYSFLHGLGRINREKERGGLQERVRYTFIARSTIAAVFLAFTAIGLFLWGTLFPYFQMRGYNDLKTTAKDPAEFSEKIDEVLYPYSYVQDVIRMDLAASILSLPQEPKLQILEEKTLTALKELSDREPYEPRFALRIAEYLEQRRRDFAGAEEYRKKAIELAPHRVSLFYDLGQNLIVQGKWEEAKKVLDELRKLSSDVPFARVLYGMTLTMLSEDKVVGFEYLEETFSRYGAGKTLLNEQDQETVIKFYSTYFLTDFYRTRDKDRFVRTVRRMKELAEGLEKARAARGIKPESATLMPSERYENFLETFEQIGWEAVEVPTSSFSPYEKSEK